MPSIAEETGAFFEALRAPGPLPGLAHQMTLYDRVLGDWSLEAIDHEADGARRITAGEVHFAWVLEGRAIQDVWIVPRRELRHPDLPRRGNRYGTTLRVYDPEADAWRVTWVNPVTGVMNQLVGRRRGDDIVQEGTRADGALVRWSFCEITPSSFHWKGESSPDGGRTWRLEAEFLGRRMAPGDGAGRRG